MTIDRDLPLVDLHRHLDGNIRPETIWQLAKEYNVVLPTTSVSELKQRIQIQHPQADLIAFLAKMELGVSVIGNPEACFKIAYENVEDAFQAGLTYVELRFSPAFMAHAFNLPLVSVVEAVVAGCKAGAKDYGIPVNLIGIMSRSYGLQPCMFELQALLSKQDDLCGIDLAGDEKGFPAKDFVEHFSKVRDAGLNVTVHAGEADGAHSIWDAINHLGATRIGHGVAAREDEYLMDYMAEHDVAIECCLTSNFQTGAVQDIAKHPIRYFLTKGIQVSLNTDDPGVSGIEIGHEYKIAKEVVGLSSQQLKDIQLNGVTSAFLSDSAKKQLFLRT